MVDLYGSSANMENLLRIHSRPTKRLKETVHTFQVHAGEELGINHALHGLLHAKQGVGILLGSGIQAMDINTKPEQPILFPHQHHSIAPWRLRGSDGATIQHLLDVMALLIH